MLFDKSTQGNLSAEPSVFLQALFLADYFSKVIAIVKMHSISCFTFELVVILNKILCILFFFFFQKKEN